MKRLPFYEAYHRLLVILSMLSASYAALIVLDGSQHHSTPFANWLLNAPLLIMGAFMAAYVLLMGRDSLVMATLATVTTLLIAAIV